MNTFGMTKAIKFRRAGEDLETGFGADIVESLVTFWEKWCVQREGRNNFPNRAEITCLALSAQSKS